MQIYNATDVLNCQAKGNLLPLAQKKALNSHSSASDSDKTTTPQRPDIKDYRKPDGSADWEAYRKADYEYRQQVEKNNIAHHNVFSPDIPYKNPELLITKKPDKSYGVQSSNRLLTKSMFSRRFDDIRDFLTNLGFIGPLQREAVLKLIKFHVYYGKVYPKAQTVADDCYISKRTVWLAIRKLQDMGLLERNQQFINGYQTSTHYIIDKLVMVVAHRVAEIGQALNEYAHRAFKAFNDFWCQIRDPGTAVNLCKSTPVQLKLIT
jgi:hypothetical protein